MYVFIDTDSTSETFGKYSVRDGCISYDGFDTEDEAIIFMHSLINS